MFLLIQLKTMVTKPVLVTNIVQNLFCVPKEKIIIGLK